MDLRPIYFAALENTGRIVSGVDPSRYSAPTPCHDWNTRELVNHVVGGVWGFARSLEGEKIDPNADVPDLIGEDPGAAFRAAQKSAVEAWSAEDALERTVYMGSEMPAKQSIRIALMEAVVHGWDIAKATGQEAGTDPMTATAMLDGLRKAITPDQRGEGKIFGPEVKVPEDAPIEAQLVAFLGRNP